MAPRALDSSQAFSRQRCQGEAAARRRPRPAVVTRPLSEAAAPVKNVDCVVLLTLTSNSNHSPNYDSTTNYSCRKYLQRVPVLTAPSLSIARTSRICHLRALYALYHNTS